MRFKTFGPFPINANIECKSEDLAKKFNAAQPELNEASGVYIFAYTKENALQPIYVGKAQRQSFGSRIAQHLNGMRFAEFLDDRAGTLSIFLIARVDDKDHFLRAKVDADEELTIISELEFSLIGTCASLNENLLNLHRLKHPEKVHVPGYLGSKPDASDTSACDLAKMLHKGV